MPGKRLISILMVGTLLVLLVTAGFTVAFNDRGEGSSVADNIGLGDDDDHGPGEKGEDQQLNDDDEDDDDDEDEEDEEDDEENDDDEDDDDEDDDEDDDDEDDKEYDGSIGHFSNGTDGRFVSFNITDDLIKNYTVKRENESILCFNQIMLEGFSVDEEENKGSFYEIEGDDTEIRIYDVSPGLMKIDIERDEWSNVSFNLGDFQVDGQSGPNLNLTYGNYSAKILSVSRGPPSNVPPTDTPQGPPNGTGNPPVNVTPPNPEKGSIDMTIENGYVNYSFVGDMFLLFRMTDLGENEQEREQEREMKENITNGISNGEVGGEIVIDRENSDFKDITVTYADMNMMTQVEGENKVRVMVSSDTLGENGKIVVAEISKQIMNVTKLKDLMVKFDGEEIEMADDYMDLKDTSDGPEYLVSIGQDKVQVLVMVPHFSTHTIDIIRAVDTEIDMVGNLSYYIPAVLITAIIVASTVWISKKR